MADVELLPLELPERFEFTRQEIRALMRDYARANMEPLIAENERLRAEVERFQSDTSFATAISSLRREKERAERLAEALRTIACMSEYFGKELSDARRLAEKVIATLAQEDRNG